ncbi:MAG: PEP-CTERM sorting domain-containing protein [Phycisphaerae bacterium]
MAAIAIGSPAFGDAPFFLGLGHFPGARALSTAEAVCADGSTVVGFANYGGVFGFQAFRWTRDEGMVGLGTLPGRVSSRAYGVSANGSVVVGDSYAGGPGPEAFRWTADDGMVGLGDLPGGEYASYGSDVSGDGSVVVGWSGSEQATYTFEAFRWTAEEGMVGLGDLPGLDFFSQAFGISADGAAIVGTSISDRGREAFRWTGDDGMVGLGDLPGGGFRSQAFSVSADGSVIVGQGLSDSGWEAFRWTAEEGMLGLGDLPGGSFQSKAYDVSGDGSVVVGTGIADGPRHAAFIWDAEHGMRNLEDVLTDEYGLDLTGWRLEGAWGVSADGLTIVGHGVHPNGDAEAWIAHIPEPASVALLALGIAAALQRRR